MSIVLKRGAAFLAPSGPGELNHLHVVLTDECCHGLHLVAVVSSVKENVKYDDTCEIAAGEHEFIATHSYVLYRVLNQMRAAHIRKMIAGKVFIEKAPVSEELCDRMCEGVAVSDLTKNGMRRYYEDNSDPKPLPQFGSIRSPCFRASLTQLSVMFSLMAKSRDWSECSRSAFSGAATFIFGPLRQRVLQETRTAGCTHASNR